MAKRKQLVMKRIMPSMSEVTKKLGVDEAGEVQKFVTEEVFRRLVPYIPEKTGHLRETAFVKRPWRIRVWAEYAKRQFFGVAKGGVPFDYDTVVGGPKAGSHWDRRLMADEGDAIVAAANRYVKTLKRKG